MKRVIAWVLILTLCLGLFAGCKKNEDKTPSGNVADLEAALEYIKTVYKKPSEKTPKDFQRIGNVPVNGKNYEVVWSADVGEEYIKVVKGTDGMVTIDVNETVEQDVKYKLTATISDDAGNSVSHGWNHILPAASGDMASIVNDAYALENGASMDYEVTLTGKITRINTAWSEDYKNITVTIAVAGVEDKPIQCYRLTGEGAKDLKIGDTITVTGTLKNYSGTIEFDAGCTLDKVVAAEEVKAPEDPKQILADAYALAEGGALTYKATLTGVITEVNTEYNPGYKNLTVTMVVDGASDKPIQCYRLAGEGAEKIGKGDTITVTGYIVKFKETVQFDSGCTLDSWKDTGKDEPKPEDTFVTTLVPEIVTAPKTGVAYKFLLNQKNYGKNLYMNGEMDGYYYATTYDPAQAVDVFLEEVTGGYRAYFLKDGVKTYLEMAVSGTHKNVIFTTSPTKVLKWNADINSLTCDLEIDGEKKDFYWGTYSYYKTFSASDITFVTGEGADTFDVSNFVAHLAVMKETAEEKKSAAEQAHLAMKDEYFAPVEVSDTAEDYTRKNVYEIEGEKVSVVWTANTDAVSIVDNGDGTVTVKVTRGEADVEYTLTATITDGDKKYTTSWKCNIPAVPPTSPKDIVNAAYELASGESMADTVTLTGIVCDIPSAYNEQFGNITVVIVIEDLMDKPITCYRLSGEGVKDIAFGDNITVTGKIKNYNGTIEFDQGCTMDACMTPAAIVDAAYQLEAGASLKQPYTLIGTVVSVDTAYSTQYGNITVTMAVEGCEDKPIKCYRLSGEGADQLQVGYLVAVTGTLTNYNDTSFQFAQGCILVDYAEPEVEEEEEEKLYVPKPVANPEVDQAYKYCLYQAQLKKNLYFSGKMDGYYLGTTENVAEAVDIYLEAVADAEGSYNFYFMDGDAKKYIVVYKSGTYVNIKIADEPGAAFAYNEEAATYVVDMDGTLYYLGTYGDKVDIRPSKISYITGDNAANVGVTQHVAFFATLAPAAETVEPAEPPVEVGVGYKYFMYQAQLEKALYFNGQMNGYYLGTTENLEEAVDVYLEAVADAEGSYNIYFMDGEAKKYIVVYKSGTYVNIKIADEPGAAFAYNEEAATYVVDMDGTLYYLGTYGDKVDIRPSKTSFITGDNAANVGVSQHIAQFGTVAVREIGPLWVPEPEVDTAYKYCLYQAQLKKVLYFSGKMDGYYLGTTDNMDEAVDVYLEAVTDAEGSYNFYFMDGDAKKYIVVYKSGTYVNVKIADEPGAAFAYNEEAATYVVDMDGTLYYLGTYGDKVDIRPSKTSYITGDNAANVGVTQHVAVFTVIGFVYDDIV